MNTIENNPSFSNDIRLYSHSGLCNRLRLIADYKYLSDMRNKKIQMHWVKSPQCFSLFSELFEPIEDIEFVYHKYQKNARKMRPRNTASSMGLFPHDKKIYQKNHLMFKPRQNIADYIDRVSPLLGKDYIACHIRRTDIITIQNKYSKQPPTDQFFFDFIEKHPNSKVFLATDNRSTQDKFKTKFGDKIVITGFADGNGSQRWPVRTTPVPQAVADLFLCINSKEFAGTVCSSFSDFIESYREGIRCQQEN